jgi:hypothetical protein
MQPVPKALEMQGPRLRFAQACAAYMSKTDQVYTALVHRHQSALGKLVLVAQVWLFIIAAESREALPGFRFCSVEEWLQPF